MSVVIIETTATKVSEEAVKKACETRSSGLPDWVTSEAAWLAGTFLRAAFSIAATRILWGLVFSEPRTKAIFDRASELIVYGKQEKPYGRPEGGFGGSYARPGSSPGSGPSSSGSDPFDFARHDHTRANDQGADAPQGAIYKGMAGEFAIYHHGTKYPGQEWPCAVLYKHACETCEFYVADRSGRVWCAANEKLKLVLKGLDDNQDLYEMKDFIKTMV